jgi:carboxymethylenebutenolidase
MKVTLSLFLLIGLLLPLSAQEVFTKALNESPRHHEWVKLEYGDRTLHSFLVYPEVSEKATAVILIHENRGLNDWARLMADQLAAEGFIVIAPDLLSGAGPKGGKTSDFSDTDAAREAIYGLDADQVTHDLEAVEAYLRSLPAANGTVAVAGFCWGGSQTFRYATNSEDIAAAFVFYGTGPKEDAPYAQINAPVYGFYGGNDARVNASLKHSATQMRANSLAFEQVIYEGAGHAFMRSGSLPNADGPNAKAREAAFERLVELLGEL